MLIALTQDQVAIVDDEDYEWLNRHKWHAAYDPRTRSFYARRAPRVAGKKVMVPMHREIMGFPKGLFVDHKNNDSLDNRRSNLRLATPSQNRQNQRRANMDNPTGYKGVDRPHPITGRFRARIVLNRKYINLGFFATAEEAAQAYGEAADRLYGEFAKY